MSLRVFPLTLAQANALVAELHRHHKPAQGHRFSIAVRDDEGQVHGAALIGRPVSRRHDAYATAEVTRLATDGTKNACSILYAAAARAAQAMGFGRIQTYTLASESGASLRAASWTDEGERPSGDWNQPSRGGRRTDQPQEAKRRWSKSLNPTPRKNLTVPKNPAALDFE